MTENKQAKIELDEILREFVRGVLINGVLTQEQIALYSGTSRSGLAHWLAGRRSMTLRNASKVIRLFSYERFVQFLIMRTSGQSTRDRTHQQELVHLLEQINHLLKRQLQETIDAANEDDGEGQPEKSEAEVSAGSEADHAS